MSLPQRRKRRTGRTKQRETDISEDLDHWRWMGVRFLPYMRVRPSVHKRGKKNRQLLGLCPSSSKALPMSFLSPQLQFQTLRSALLQSQHNFWSSEHALTNRQRALVERHLEGFQLADNITRRSLNCEWTPLSLWGKPVYPLLTVQCMGKLTHMPLYRRVQEMGKRTHGPWAFADGVKGGFLVFWSKGLNALIWNPVIPSGEYSFHDVVPRVSGLEHWRPFPMGTASHLVREEKHVQTLSLLSSNLNRCWQREKDKPTIKLPLDVSWSTYSTTNIRINVYSRLSGFL